MICEKINIHFLNLTTCLIFFQGTINNNHTASIITPSISEPGNNGRIIGILEINIKKEARINLINNGI